MHRAPSLLLGLPDSVREDGLFRCEPSEDPADCIAARSSGGFVPGCLCRSSEVETYAEIKHAFARNATKGNAMYDGMSTNLGEHTRNLTSVSCQGVAADPRGEPSLTPGLALVIW